RRERGEQRGPEGAGGSGRGQRSGPSDLVHIGRYPQRSTPRSLRNSCAIVWDEAPRVVSPTGCLGTDSSASAKRARIEVFGRTPSLVRAHSGARPGERTLDNRIARVILLRGRAPTNGVRAGDRSCAQARSRERSPAADARVARIRPARRP